MFHHCGAQAKRPGVLGALAFFLALAFLPTAGSAQTVASDTGKPSIVLVHGAWADGTSWNPVIKKLQAAGYTVYAPPNPLRSLATDGASIAAFVKAIPGPVVLVGHSYGGAVISVASAKTTNVKALVYVDAFALNAGESCLSQLSSGPPPPKDVFLPVPLGGGTADLYFNPKYYGAVFASDVPAAQSALMAVTQRPLTALALNEKAPAAEGWKTLPSWYVVGDADLVIPPAIQLAMAKRAKSHISHVHGSHPSMIMHPEATVTAIEAAVHGTESSGAK
jgi:pimeloyl-ACP methyl ester carboxylesterase